MLWLLALSGLDAAYPSVFFCKKGATFGGDTPMKPTEIAPGYVFSASDESSYFLR